MSDYIAKAMAFNKIVRAYAIDSTETVNVLQAKHITSPTASAAMGRAVSIGAMMGAMLKGEEKLTIEIGGDGPIGQIVVDANTKGDIRAYVSNPQVSLPLNKNGKFDVASAIGKGNINVIKDLGLKDPYRGNIEIISGELGEDFTYYFAHSEQTPSAVGVGVLVNPDNTIKASGGFIIQLLPDISDEEIDYIEQAISNIPPVSKLISEGHSPEDILEKIFNDDVNFLEKIDVNFKCNCSKEKIENILFNLGKKEIEEIMEKEGEAKVICQFCRTEYKFAENELKDILDRL